MTKAPETQSNTEEQPCGRTVLLDFKLIIKLQGPRQPHAGKEQTNRSIVQNRKHRTHRAHRYWEPAGHWQRSRRGPVDNPFNRARTIESPYAKGERQ